MGCGASTAAVPAEPLPTQPAAAAQSNIPKPSQAAAAAANGSPEAHKPKPPPLDLASIHQPSSPSDKPQPMSGRTPGAGLSIETGEKKKGRSRGVQFTPEDSLENVKAFQPSPRGTHRVVTEEEAEREDAAVAQEEAQEGDGVSTSGRASNSSANGTHSSNGPVLRGGKDSLLGCWRGINGAHIEVVLQEGAQAGILVGHVKGALDGTVRAEGRQTTTFNGKTVEDGIVFWLLLDTSTGGLRGWYSAVGGEATGEPWTGYRLRSGPPAAGGFDGVWIMSAADGEESRLALKVPASSTPPDVPGTKLTGDISISSLDDAARVGGTERSDVLTMQGMFVEKDADGGMGNLRSFVAMEDTTDGSTPRKLRLWMDGGPGVTVWKSYVLALED